MCTYRRLLPKKLNLFSNLLSIRLGIIQARDQTAARAVNGGEHFDGSLIGGCCLAADCNSISILG